MAGSTVLTCKVVGVVGVPGFFKTKQISSKYGQMWYSFEVFVIRNTMMQWKINFDILFVSCTFFSQVCICPYFDTVSIFILHIRGTVRTGDVYCRAAGTCRSALARAARGAVFSLVTWWNYFDLTKENRSSLKNTKKLIKTWSSVVLFRRPQHKKHKVQLKFNFDIRFVNFTFF